MAQPRAVHASAMSMRAHWGSWLPCLAGTMEKNMQLCSVAHPASMALGVMYAQRCTGLHLWARGSSLVQATKAPAKMPWANKAHAMRRSCSSHHWTTMLHSQANGQQAPAMRTRRSLVPLVR